jgi:hypothetical protein
LGSSRAEISAASSRTGSTRKPDSGNGSPDHLPLLWKPRTL